MHIVLQFVHCAVSTADERDRQCNATRNTNRRAYYMQSKSYHKQVAPLRAVSPALLMIFAYVSVYLRETNTNSDHNIDNNSTHSNYSESSGANALLAYCHLLDSHLVSAGLAEKVDVSSYLPRLKLFQHELLQSFSFHLFAKRPIEPINTLPALRRSLIQSMVLSALQIRLKMCSSGWIRCSRLSTSISSAVRCLRIITTTNHICNNHM